MQRADYIQFILDNIAVFDLSPPETLQNPENLKAQLEPFDDKLLKAIAGFNKTILNYFLQIVGDTSQEELDKIVKKLEQLSYYVRPTGNLSYLSPEQINYVLKEIPSLKIVDITPEKISSIVDAQLEKEFSGDQYTKTEAFQNQLESARYYLSSIGYSRQDIEQKIKEVSNDPAKLEQLFTLEEKEIYNLPEELQEDGEKVDENIIEHHIQAIQQDINDERAKKVAEILTKIKSEVADDLTENYERVFKQMHPDRLNRIYKFLRENKRKEKRKELYIEWFFSSHLLENIELKVEHWQVSSRASHQSTGVYTAGVSFSRYDNIIKDFSDEKLAKVLSIARKILKKPSKKRIQKLGQDLIAETGFDEHLYFTD